MSYQEYIYFEKKYAKEEGREEGLREGEEKGRREGEEKGLREGKEKGRLEERTKLKEKLLAKGMSEQEITLLLG